MNLCTRIKIRRKSFQHLLCNHHFLHFYCVFECCFCYSQMRIHTKIIGLKFAHKNVDADDDDEVVIKRGGRKIERVKKIKKTKKKLFPFRIFSLWFSRTHKRHTGCCWCCGNEEGKSARMKMGSKKLFIMISFTAYRLSCMWQTHDIPQNTGIFSFNKIILCKHTRKKNRNKIKTMKRLKKYQIKWENKKNSKSLTIF